MLFVYETEENAIILGELPEYDSRGERLEAMISIGNAKYVAVNGYVRIPYHGEMELVERFSALRDQNLPFLNDPSRWGAANLFDFLREKGLLTGPVRTIYWTGMGKYEFGTL